MQEEQAPASDDIIRLAFDLPEQPGVDLLLRLGALDLWRGDLAAMRNDTPPATAENQPKPAEQSIAGAERLYAGVLMRRALDDLQPRCRKTLFLKYVEGRDSTFIARELGCSLQNADELVLTCRRRAYEISRDIETYAGIPAGQPAISSRKAAG